MRAVATPLYIDLEGFEGLGMRKGEQLFHGLSNAPWIYFKDPIWHSLKVIQVKS